MKVRFLGTGERNYLPQIVLFMFMLLLTIGCGHKGPQWLTESYTTTASNILETTGVTRGIYVVLGDSLCQLSRELVRQSELVIYTQFPNQKDVEAARQHMDKEGFYGTRIYVEKGDLQRIHLANDLADAVIAVGKTDDIATAEVLRVLRPQGKAFVGEQILTKPFPKGIDDWSHLYHAPDNNTQSNDQIIKAPYLTRFFAEPRYAPAAQVAVASAGRVFKAFGNVAFHEREEPFLNTLVAFNGYNGTMLWKRELVPGIMVHRSTIIATPDILYLGDDRSCKMIDTRTGRIVDEIKPAIDIAGGTFWKWMALQDGVLYALIGEQEPRDPVMRWRRTVHGWPWSDISDGFNQPENPWGFGRNVVAVDPGSKKVLWHYQEEESIDSRAMCMTDGKIFLYRFGSFLTCLSAKSGTVIWRKTPDNAPELFAALGQDLNRQGYAYNWRTIRYVVGGDNALYFAGPQVDRLVAVSTKDGRLLWQNPYNNFQLVLRQDGLYAISGPWRNNVSKIFDPLTGEVLAELDAGRRACTRPNASSDAIFYRALGGTVRLDIASRQQQWISPMRPQCQDGVTIANGMLYWWPYVCDCQLTIYGVTGLGPAGNFDFSAPATEAERLEEASPTSSEALLQTSADWPTFRQNNQGRTSTPAVVPTAVRNLWRYPQIKRPVPATNILGFEFNLRPTAPVTVDGLAFWAGTDGIVRAIDVQSGQLLWKAYTGGAVRIPPTVWEKYVLVGSGDGWVYNFDVRTGHLNWRFRAAPAERKIPVYGSMLSTWPAASGVLVQDGVAYVAAGILNFDGTHVYALDVESGKIIWQNNTSGHLLPEARTGVSVQGHLLLHNGKLYLASGTSLSPAVYDAKTGQCLNDPEPLKKCESYSPRGWELYLIGDKVVAGGKPFYGHPREPVFDVTVTNKLLYVPDKKRDIMWVNQRKVLCFPHIDKEIMNKCVTEPSKAQYIIPIWGNLDVPYDPIWEYNSDESIAIAVCKNAVIVAEKSQLVGLDIRTGKPFWSVPLEYPPVPWGMAISRDGRIVLTLEDGSVQCFGGVATTPVPYVASNNTYFVGQARVTLACDSRNAEIRYTLDGSEPTKKSQLYTGPFKITSNAILKMRAFPRDGIPGLVVREQFQKVDYQTAEKPDEIEPGLWYEYYEGYCDSVADLAKYKPVKSGVTMNFDLKPRDAVNVFGYIYRGYILVPRDGIYTFYLKSNDGSKLYINGQQVVDNDGGHSAIEKSGKIALKAGEYPIVVKYFQMGGGKMLRVSWEGPGLEKQKIDARVLFHRPKGKAPSV